MANQGVLYGPTESFRTQKILVSAKYGGTSVQHVPDKKLDTQSFPFGKYPAYESKDGKYRLHDTHAIATLLGKNLTGANPEQNAEVVQWLDLADNEFLPHVLAWTLPALSAMEYNKNQVEESKKELLRLLGILDKFLLTRTYLVGERISLADVALVFNLLPAFQNVLEPELRRPFVNVSRWLTTLVNQPEFKAVIGDSGNHLCTKAAQFDAQKHKEFQDAIAGAAASCCQKDAQVSPTDSGIGISPMKETELRITPSANLTESDKDVQTKKKKGKKDKDKKGKKDAEKSGDNAGQKKEEKKKDKKAAEQNGPAGDAEEEMDATELALAEEPAQKDPFNVFPKGTFNMDEFKRVYSNEDTATKAIPYFWEHFDKENFSIWIGTYKFSDELTLVFKSCNLITGMFQRLDKMRKNAFASVCLFGTDNNSTISGIWIWRGHELAFKLSDDWQVDYESYEWQKLDANSDETKKMVNEYLLWEGNFGGKKFNQGKIYK